MKPEVTYRTEWQSSFNKPEWWINIKHPDAKSAKAEATASHKKQPKIKFRAVKVTVEVI